MPIQFEKAENGLLTAKYKGKYIHSRYNPQREAEVFVKNNIKYFNGKTIALYGIGLGYHIKEMLKLITEDSAVYVFEMSDELIKEAKIVNPDIFNSDNIKIIDGKSINFYQELVSAIEEAGNLVVHKPSLEMIRESFPKLFNVINDFSSIRNFSTFHNENYMLGEANRKVNISKEYPDISILIDKLSENNKPFIIASAGPSLDYELKTLEKYRDEFTVISVGSSLRTLVNNNILPDAIVIIDPKQIIEKQFIGFENLSIPLCFPASASKWAVEVYNGPKYMFNKCEENTQILVGGTVALSALDIAKKSCAKKIIFIGQDFAYLGEKSHTATYEKMYGFKDSEKTRHKMRIVQGVLGNNLETSDGYLVFKHKVEYFIHNCKDIEFINCSRGAAIEGTKFMTLEEFINKL
ncbi:6-hydroxymethylpterin diphosphokinase MptE-like protein [Clostridium sp. BJN0001]|uniref:motility associated factor glycosyltransferase family protein n=1 Tax=Clostridium sp. BJN0001 TaxID=2930219 RepID=UPI001FD3111D|nr:6-hydroxymethylpterin diphosphokinase MptE-like protein [Clostridium sp. BJN0001]